MERLKNWWKLDGKVVAYKFLLLLLFLGPILKSIPAVKRWLPDDTYPLVFLAGALFLLLQIVMALVGEKPADVKIAKFNPTDPAFAKRIKRAKRLYIAYSSTETLFAYIQEPLRAAKVECRVLLRNPEAGNERMVHKLRDYEARWKSLRAANPRCKVQVKYSNNTAFRLIIIDDTEAYFGVYRLIDGRLVGHDVPMLHIDAGTPLADYFLATAINRFNALWLVGTEEIGERPALV